MRYGIYNTKKNGGWLQIQPTNGHIKYSQNIATAATYPSRKAAAALIELWQAIDVDTSKLKVRAIEETEAEHDM